MYDLRRQIIGYVLAVVCALVIGSGLMVGATAHAWDQGAHNWADERRMEAQQEQSTWQRNQDQVQRQWQDQSQQYNRQQERQQEAERSHNYNLYQSAPGGGSRQMNCITAGHTTVCN